jgi:hypothetical protein
MKHIGCLATPLSEEERAKGTTILVFNSDPFWWKITELGEDVSVLFPLRDVLLFIPRFNILIILEIGQRTTCNL